MSGNLVSVLLVEDDEIDAEAVQRAFRKHNMINPIVIAKDGVEALECLRGEQGRERISRPYIVLLDINLPRLDGHEFLDELREDENIRDSVVFVLTTSEAKEDLERAYGKNVAGYIIKSRAGADFTQLVSLLDIYWTYVELPRPRVR